MKTNVGSIDKIVRIVGGVTVVGWGFYAQNWLGAIGVVPLLTAAMGWCPLYTVLGIKTCSIDKV